MRPRPERAEGELNFQQEAVNGPSVSAWLECDELCWESFVCLFLFSPSVCYPVWVNAPRLGAGRKKKKRCLGGSFCVETDEQ